MIDFVAFCTQRKKGKLDVTKESLKTEVTTKMYTEEVKRKKKKESCCSSNVMSSGISSLPNISEFFYAVVGGFEPGIGRSGIRGGIEGRGRLLNRRQTIKIEKSVNQGNNK
jgi:hypothetical protein